MKRRITFVAGSAVVALLFALGAVADTIEPAQSQASAAAQKHPGELARAVAAMEAARIPCSRNRTPNIGECAQSDNDEHEDTPEARLARAAIEARSAFLLKCSHDQLKRRCASMLREALAQSAG